MLRYESDELLQHFQLDSSHYDEICDLTKHATQDDDDIRPCLRHSF